MERRIITLRERGEVAVERSKRALLIAAAAGAAVGTVLVGGYVVYRITRPPTARERMERVIPRRWWSRLDNLRDAIELGIRKQVPPMRLYVNDRMVGEEPPANTAQKVLMRVAQAAGTAIGGAIVQRLMSRLDRSRQ
jgi:sugar phosphate isomerase/epimerase